MLVKAYKCTDNLFTNYKLLGIPNIFDNIC